MRKTLGPIFRSVLAMLAVPALVLITAQPAQAHYNYIYQGNDLVSVASSHAALTVCDKENDGNNVVAHYGTKSNYWREWDNRDSGCDTESNNVARANVFRLCENLDGYLACTGWQRL